MGSDREFFQMALDSCNFTSKSQAILETNSESMYIACDDQNWSFYEFMTTFGRQKHRFEGRHCHYAHIYRPPYMPIYMPILHV